MFCLKLHVPVYHSLTFLTTSCPLSQNLVNVQSPALKYWGRKPPFTCWPLFVTKKKLQGETFLVRITFELKITFESIKMNHIMGKSVTWNLEPLVLLIHNNSTHLAIHLFLPLRQLCMNLRMPAPTKAARKESGIRRCEAFAA